MYEGHWQIIHTPPSPPRTKTKGLLVNLRFNYFKVLIVAVGALLDCFNQDRKKGKKSTFARNLNVALTPSSTSLRVKTAIPCVLSFSFKNKRERIAGG